MTDLDAVKQALIGASPKRPAYFDDPSIDRVLGVVMSLAGEVAVTGERMDTLERVLAAKGLVSSLKGLCPAKASTNTTL